MGKTVLVSGASVAGPAVAFWLARYGFEVTVVEIAPGLRPGGYAIDFSGPTHLGVLDRMGIRADLQARATGGRASRFVDRDGRTLFRLPAEFTGGDLEIPRSEVSQLLYDRSRDRVEYRFGDTVTALQQRSDGVDVSFREAPTQRFDLVIGADGMHSVIRRLAFAPENQCVSDLGYRLAGWDLDNHWDLHDELVFHNQPGTLAGLSANVRDPSRADAYALFASSGPDDPRHDRAGQHRRLEQAFAGQRWHVPELLAAMPQAEDVYFDAVARVDLQRWSAGRVVLLGDAACGATLSGLGTGLAVVSAYVLAGELARESSVEQAFAAYERIIRPYATRCQGEAPARLLAPAGSIALRARDLVLRTAAGRALVMRFGGKAIPGPDLPVYADALA